MADMVTVFRSADPGAEDEANQVLDLLAGGGIAACVFNDDAPGVTEGAWEVRVAVADSARAQALVDANPPPGDSPDQSHSFDLVPVFTTADGSTEGFEPITVKELLEANGISAIIANDSPLASLSQEVRVARADADIARQLIEEARAAGPEAADEAERLTE